MSEDSGRSDEEGIEHRQLVSSDTLSEKEVLIQHGRKKGEGKAYLSIYAYCLCTFAALGGFLFGYDTGVVSGAMILLREEFSLSVTWQELLVSATIATAIVGALLGGVFSDKLGRRPILLICSAVFTGGAVVMAVAHSKEILLLGRAIVGLGIGGASMTVPLYIAESTPSSIRGQLVTVNNVFITGGQFIASLIDGIFATHPGGWRYMLGLAAVPSICMFTGCLFLPESPRWLVKKKKLDTARKVLIKLRGTADVEEEIQSIRQVCQEEEASEKKTNRVLCRMLTDANTRRGLLVGCMLQAVQQLSGINTVMYYSATIILLSGIGNEKVAIWLAAAVAFGNLLFTLVGVFLVERIGRRKLLLSSLFLVAISLFLIGGAFYLADLKDPSAVYKERGGAKFPQCSSIGDCKGCVAKDTCGFCYLKDSTGNYVNGSCVFSNASTHIALYGRCSEKEDSALWRYSACPSKYAWLAFLGLILYIASFAPGMGPMPWTINSEIYPLWARSTGVACSTATNWALNLIIAMTFLHLINWITSAGTFWFYGCAAIAGWIFFYIFVPETRGKSLEELESIMVPNSNN